MTKILPIEELGDAHKIKIKYSGENWEQWFLLMADEHFDSVYCDRNLLKRHHEMAKERNAIILKFGDTFDCMGGKYDKRTHKELVRPELQKQDYFDAIIREAEKFYLPYKDNIVFVSMGNHEYSILKRNEINLISRFAEKMDAKVGGYRGFIRLQFIHGNTDGGRISKDIYYVHGSGNGAPVTRGVIKTNRRQDMILADYYVSGHSHMEFNLTRPVGYLSQQGKIKIKEPEHISLGTYMNTFMKNTWEDRREFAPESMGGVWLHFTVKHINNRYNPDERIIISETIRAK
ncbi:MAG: hypothetical protein WC579_01520 [Candidatus Paceibacterota bacterium]